METQETNESTTVIAEPAEPVKKQTKSARKPVKKTAKRSPKPANKTAGVESLRKRQGLTKGVLDRCFGRFRKSTPELLDQRAYLMLIGTIYEKLALDGTSVPLDELMSLAKVLAEGTKSRPKRLRKGARTAPAAGVQQTLPPALQRPVQEIYGATPEEKTCDPMEAQQPSSDQTGTTQSVTGEDSHAATETTGASITETDS